jgi:dephospho-CoA kinase
VRESREHLIVGLTGGIASGKSAVAEELGSRGCRLVEADRIVHALLEPSQQGFGEVIKHFGTRILARDGRVDKRELARIVFEDPEERRALEGILHPMVLREEERIVRALSGKGLSGIVVFEVTLIVEAGVMGRYDRIVVVHAPEDLRIARLRARGMAEEDARARISAQAGVEAGLEIADYALENTGSREELRELAAGLHDSLREDWKAKKAGALSPPRHEADPSQG